MRDIEQGHQRGGGIANFSVTHLLSKVMVLNVLNSPKPPSMAADYRNPGAPTSASV